MRSLAVALALLVMAVPSRAATFTWPADFAASTSLNDAIEASVSSGDTVLIEAGDYIWDDTTTHPSVQVAGDGVSGGMNAPGDNVTIAAKDGPGTVLFQNRAPGFAIAWLDPNSEAPSGWTIDGITFESDISFGMLVRVDYLDSWSFTNCTFRAGAEGWGSLAILNLGTASNIRFEDCDISNAGYTTGNILRMNSAAVGWTFERCTFDLSTMGAISGVTLYDVSGAQDWTFDTCSFIGPSSIAGTVFQWVFSDRSGTLASDVDFVRCSFTSPTSAAGGAAWVAVKFTDGASNCDVIASTFTSSLPASVNVNAVKYEDATGGEGYVSNGHVIGSRFTNYRIGILFGERANSCVAAGNYIIGQNGSDDDGIYFQDARYCVATNNWIERCGRSGIRFSAGDECQSGTFCNFGNVAVGNYVRDSARGVYVIENGGVSTTAATTDSASVRAGNIFDNVSAFAQVGSTEYYIGNWTGYAVDDAYGLLENGLATVRTDSTDALGGLRINGALPGGTSSVVGPAGAGIE